MLDLTMGGKCMSGLDAIEFFETLPDSIDDCLKTEEFCDEYECALNRLRYEVRKSIPVTPKLQKAYSRGHKDFVMCGACGAGLDLTINSYCSKCGQRVGAGKTT